MKSIRPELKVFVFFFDVFTRNFLSNVQQIMNNLHTVALYKWARMKIKFLVSFLCFFTLLILEIANSIIKCTRTYFKVKMKQNLML